MFRKIVEKIKRFIVKIYICFYDLIFLNNLDFNFVNKNKNLID